MDLERPTWCHSLTASKFPAAGIVLFCNGLQDSSRVCEICPGVQLGYELSVRQNALRIPEARIRSRPPRPPLESTARESIPGHPDLQDS